MMDHSSKTVDVVLQGNQFVNSTITIYEGDTVRWTHNDGMIGHNVASDNPAFNSHPNCALPVLPAPLCMADGEVYTQHFGEVGDVAYVCEVHSGMTGTIRVLAHPE